MKAFTSECDSHERTICFVSVEEEVTFDGSLRSVYLESCRKNKIIPANYFLRHMLDPDLAMRHHGLGPDGIKPLSVALVVRLATVIFRQSAPTRKSCYRTLMSKRPL